MVVPCKALIFTDHHPFPQEINAFVSCPRRIVIIITIIQWCPFQQCHRKHKLQAVIPVCRIGQPQGRRLADDKHRGMMRTDMNTRNTVDIPSHASLIQVPPNTHASLDCGKSMRFTWHQLEEHVLYDVRAKRSWRRAPDLQLLRNPVGTPLLGSPARPHDNAFKPPARSGKDRRCTRLSRPREQCQLHRSTDSTRGCPPLSRNSVRSVAVCTKGGVVEDAEGQSG